MEYKTKHAPMKFPSTVALLISVHMNGNLKILRIYVSNFIVRSYVRSTLLATYDDTSPFPGACSAITERRVSVLSNAICAVPLKTANRSGWIPGAQTATKTFESRKFPFIIKQFFVYDYKVIQYLF